LDLFGKGLRWDDRIGGRGRERRGGVWDDRCWRSDLSLLNDEVIQEDFLIKIKGEAFLRDILCQVFQCSYLIV
jgi:hypothetical protein